MADEDENGVTEQSAKQDDEDEEAGDQQYEVEAILERKVIGRKTMYRVKWVGYEESASTWEPVSNLSESKDIILEFEERSKLKEQTSSKASHSARSDTTTSGRRGFDSEAAVQGSTESRSTVSRGGGASARLAKAAVKSKTGQQSDESDDDSGLGSKRLRADQARSTATSRSTAAAKRPRSVEDDGVKDETEDEKPVHKPSKKVADKDSTADSPKISRQASKASVSQASRKKPSTLPEEIFPTGSNGSASGDKANGSTENRGKGTIDRFTQAPVYAKLADVKGGAVELKDLSIRGLFLSTDSEAFVLLSTRGASSGSSKKKSDAPMEFYVDALNVANQSDDMARQMITTLADNIKVVVMSPRNANN